MKSLHASSPFTSLLKFVTCTIYKDNLPSKRLSFLCLTMSDLNYVKIKIVKSKSFIQTPNILSQNCLRYKIAYADRLFLFSSTFRLGEVQCNPSPKYTTNNSVWTLGPLVFFAKLKWCAYDPLNFLRRKVLLKYFVLH